MVDKPIELESEPPIDKKVVYDFPKTRCPRCGANDTVAYAKHGDTQYRRCIRSVCRKNFAVKGTPI